MLLHRGIDEKKQKSARLSTGKAKQNKNNHNILIDFSFWEPVEKCRLFL